MGTPRPFHLSIVEAIRRARDAQTLSVLASLINDTEIIINHDEIVEAWKEKLVELGHEVTFSIVNGVLAQKERKRPQWDPEEDARLREAAKGIGWDSDRDEPMS